MNIGDDVMMMGFAVGKITSVEPQKPYEKNNVKVQFEIKDPYFRYLWTGGSFVKVNAAGFLNQRQLEVTRATNGYALVVTQPVSIQTLDEAKKLMYASPDDWQLAQDIFNADTNLLFHAYDHLEQVFSKTNVALLATAVVESNSIYIFNNKVNRKRIVASWDGRVHHYKIFKPVTTPLTCAPWRCRRLPTSCRRWFRRRKTRCREFLRSPTRSPPCWITRCRPRRT
ncbi:MAG: MlaD family protein [Limisphaerales bacterium]